MKLFAIRHPITAAVAGALLAAAPMGAMLLAAPLSAKAAESLVSADGLLTLTLVSSNPSDAVGIPNTYTWTVTNNSASVTLNGVVLGSHWGDWCGGGNCTPPGPTLISAPGCASQGPDEIPLDAHFGIWCTPLTGATLPPGQSVSGSVTLRPGAGGPPDYTVYTFHDLGGVNTPGPLPITFITHNALVAPAATDIQIKGAASNGAPPAGSTFSYTFEMKNAGPWGTFGGVTLVDTLPASLTFVSAFINIVSPLTGQLVEVATCSVAGQTVMCPIGELQSSGGVDQQQTVTINVAASATPQQIVNTASVLTRLPQTDSNSANNSTTITVTTK